MSTQLSIEYFVEEIEMKFCLIWSDPMGLSCVSYPLNQNQ